MNLQEFLCNNPKLDKLMLQIPESVKNNASVKKFEKNSIIQRKDDNLEGVSIICTGKVRVVNEFGNGNICVIEENSAIDFIGEVTALANKQNTSVTIEALTDCTIIYLSLKDFFDWIHSDNSFLLLVSKRLAEKLYDSSYEKGIELFYPAIYLVSKFLIGYTKANILEQDYIIVNLTRQRMSENIGITIRTVNRIIKELKEDNFISVKKGKIIITKSQYERLVNYVEDMVCS